jgi:hypothetical protein
MQTFRNVIGYWAVIGCIIAFARFVSAPAIAGDAVDWSSASDLQVMLHAVEQTEPTNSSPRLVGTFWSAQHAPGTTQPWPPLPGNFRQTPVWDLGDNTYLLNDLGAITTTGW